MLNKLEEEEEIKVKRGPLGGKSLIYIIVIVFVISLILVGVLSGILSASKVRKEEKEKYEKQIKDMLQRSVTTEMPSTSTTISTTQKKTTPTKECKELWCNVRLPEYIRPNHYNLEIEAFPDQLKYNGTVTIQVNVQKKTNTLVIHTKDNLIVRVKVNKRDSNSDLPIKDHFEYKENEYYVIRLQSEIESGEYDLTVYFQSNVSKTLTGFYKSSYLQKDGNKSVLLTTKFQPTDARKAFPCLDEPDMKARFTITMLFPNKYHARSNMPNDGADVVIGDRIKRRFKKTVVMSTYLVCFIISQFDMKYTGKSGIKNNTDVTIWSRPEFVDSTEYAFNASIKMLTFLEDFLGVPYPMPKLDMFAIPDYGSGATEHWGIITYRETRLLYFEGTSSFSNKQSTAGIISHECAHLWFGNLVTCKWWNDLWVQEGMASYLEYYAQDHVHPEWKMMDKFLSVDWNTGMTLDALTSSHPISQRVDHPKQIKEIFDSITYNKGSSLFHMLDVYLGQEVFKDCLKHYLSTHQFKGATVTDLWNSFSNVSKENINAVMDTWTQQMGHPVVNITKSSDSFTITQKHFLIDSKANVTTVSPFNYQWQIPFLYITSDDKNSVKKMVIKNKQETVKSTSDYLLGNYNHGGFYRVNYDDATWNKLIGEMETNASVFTVKDRAGILDDSFKLAQADYIVYDVPLKILKALENDTSSLTWSFAFKNLAYIDKVLSAQEKYSDFRKYMRKVLSRFLQPGSKIKYLYSGCKYGHEYAVKYSSNLFNEWMRNGTAVPVDIRSTVYSCGVMHGGDREWDFVLQQYLSNNNPTERSKLQSALSMSTKPWIINKWLQYSLDASKVRTQDTVYVIGAVAAYNPVGKYLAFNFVSENWLKIMSIAKENNFHTASITSQLTSQFTTPFDLQQVEDLWKKYPDAGTGANARKQGLEKINSNILWLEKNYDTITKWLESA